MSKGWTQKLKLPLLLGLVALFAMGYRCSGGGSPPSETPPDGRSSFYPEYDYMDAYDAFAYGTARAVNAFAPCGTDLNVFFDEVITPAQVLHYDSVGYFMMQHAQLTGSPDAQFVYKSYLLAIEDAHHKPVLPPPFGEILGRTYDTGSGYAWAVIFVQAIIDEYPGYPDMIDKTAIHEMGHMRADLTHLCYTPDSVNWYMSPYHDDSSCVMGQARISLCTNKDLATNPHFCPACCGRLKQVQW
jgi:hypothetical protein